MIVICIALGMTGNTGKDCIVRGVGVTIRTTAPLTFMPTAVDCKAIHAIVIKISRRPSWVRSMAGSAIYRESSSKVIWIGSSVIIVKMTLDTVGGGIIIIVIYMTGSTIGNIVPQC